MILAQAISDVRRDEGYSAVVYDDATGEPIKKGSVVVGNPTLWYGLRVDQPAPRDAAELALKLVMGGQWATLLYAQPWLQDQPEDVQRALQNMAYQIGGSGVGKFVLMLAALHRGDRETAAVNCLDSDYGRDFPDRAGRVATLIRGHAPEGDD